MARLFGAHLRLQHHGETCIWTQRRALGIPVRRCDVDIVHFSAVAGHLDDERTSPWFLVIFDFVREVMVSNEFAIPIWMRVETPALIADLKAMIVQDSSRHSVVLNREFNARRSPAEALYR